jgi:hypothetical protein
LEAKLTTLLCEKIIVAKSKEVEIRLNLSESSKEGYGSKSAVLLLMITFLKESSTTEQNRTEQLSSCFLYTQSILPQLPLFHFPQ